MLLGAASPSFPDPLSDTFGACFAVVGVSQRLVCPRPARGDVAEVNAGAPVLSVVIATTQAWPAMRIALDSVLPQARAVGAEIIVADGSGQGLPVDFDAADVVLLGEPGASVFRLRALGLARARGEVVAMTEDHCRVHPGWCAAVIRAHRDYPHAAAIGGVVENGATERLIDWANFFVANGRFIPPVRSGEAEVISGQANLSYKRRVVPREVPTLGVMEFLYTRSLRDRGEVLVTDDRLVVEHVQSGGLADTSAMHFHNGRSIAGFIAQGMRSPARLLRALGSLVNAPVGLVRTLGSVLRKRGFARRALTSLHLIVWLIMCHASGELVGYLLGPGDSPQRLQ